MPNRVPQPLELNPLMLAEIMRRLLRVGVPPTAIANAFDMDTGPLKVLARQVRREAYGTDELAEAHTFAHWLAYEKLVDLIQHGSPELSAKVSMQILAKSMSITARQTPEEVSQARAALATLTEDLEITDAELDAEAEAYEQVRGQFVPSDDLEE